MAVMIISKHGKALRLYGYKDVYKYIRDCVDYTAGLDVKKPKFVPLSVSVYGIGSQSDEPVYLIQNGIVMEHGVENLKRIRRIKKRDRRVANLRSILIDETKGVCEFDFRPHLDNNSKVSLKK